MGSYRAAAKLCGTTPKTVRRAVAAADAARADPAPAVVHNYDAVADIVAERVAKTNGLISAKRLLPSARAAGYAGSARNFRRLVAKAKKAWRSDHHRGRRPGVWAPGDMVVIDWGPDRVAVSVLRGAGLEPVPRRLLRRQPANETTLAALAAARRNAPPGWTTVLALTLPCG